MAIPDIDKRAEELRSHISLLETWWKTLDDDDESDAAQLISKNYLVVSAYGMVEGLLKERLIHYIENNCPPNFIDVVTKIVSTSYGWNYDKVKSVFKALNENWMTNLNSQMPEINKEAITTLKNNRDKIAHGSSSPVTFTDTKSYFENAVEGLHIIYSIIDEG